MSQLQVTGEAKIRTLTGALTATAGVVTSVPLGAANGVATLGGDGKVPSAQLPTMGSSYKGTWNAATNTPTIADGVGTAGDYYLVSTGGTWNGIVFLEGNTVIYSGTVWQKAGGGSGTVTSVGLAAPAAFSVSGSPVTSTGTLTLAGAGTTNDYIKGDGTLAVFNSAAISAVSGTYLALAGGTMTGQIVLKESSSSSDFTKGLRFPNDPFGGSGDTSGLRLYATSGESMVLELYVQNDSGTDKINFATGIAGGLSNDDVTINGNKIWNAGNLTPQTQLNGTGFVKATGTTISYDNSTYLTTSAASSTYLPLAGGTLTGPLNINAGGGATLNILGGGDIVLYAETSGANTTFYNDTGVLNITTPTTIAGNLSTTTDLISSNGTLYISAGSGLTYSSRLSTAYNFPYVDTYLDSFGGASYEGRLNFRTNSGGGAMSTKMTILNNGSVGIGTITIGSKLQINGNLAVGYSASFAAPTNGLQVSGEIISEAGISVSNVEGGVASNYYGTFSGGSTPLSFLYGSSGTVTWNNGGAKMVLSSSGNLQVVGLSGTGSRTVTADASGNLSASSDSSLKQEDKTHQIEGLTEILKLQPRAYKWLSDIEIRGEEAVTEIGFFADEVNTIIPSAAPKGTDNLYGFYDRAVIAALVKGMQEQQKQIQELKEIMVNLKLTNN